MAYIDYKFYSDDFGGKSIPRDEFDKIAEIASTIIDEIVYCKIDRNSDYFNEVKKAVAYEADTIYNYGGYDVAVGMSDCAISSEHLGDYSYSLGGGDTSHNVTMMNGIPVTPIAVSILSNAGLRQRWAYAYEDGDTNEP